VPFRNAPGPPAQYFATKGGKSRFVKLERQWLHIEPMFGMNWGLLLGTTILKEPGMEFPIEELSVCNTRHKTLVAHSEEQTEPRVAPQQTLTLLK
jgi:hypothetical protein